MPTPLLAALVSALTMAGGAAATSIQAPLFGVSSGKEFTQMLVTEIVLDGTNFSAVLDIGVTDVFVFNEACRPSAEASNCSVNATNYYTPHEFLLECPLGSESVDGSKCVAELDHGEVSAVYAVEPKFSFQGRCGMLPMNLAVIEKWNSDELGTTIHADSILGLDMYDSGNELFRGIRSKHQDTQNLFSVCIDATKCSPETQNDHCGSGRIVFGSLDTRMHTQALQYAKVVNFDGYAVATVKGTGFIYSKGDYDFYDAVSDAAVASFDLGSAHTYLQKHEYAAFKSKLSHSYEEATKNKLTFQSFRTPNGSISASEAPKEDCFEIADEDVAKLPQFLVTFQGGAVFGMPPDKYTFRTTRDHKSMVCLAVKPLADNIESNIILLGLNAIGNTYVAFDFDHNQVAFTDANCSDIGETNVTAVVELADGVSQTGSAEPGRDALYSFPVSHIDDTSASEVTVIVTPISGDADLYVSNGGDLGDEYSSRKSGEVVERVVVKVGKDTQDISIVVRAFLRATQFSVLAIQHEVPTLLPGVPITMHGNRDEQLLFRFVPPPILFHNDETIIVRVSPQNGDTDLYVRAVDSTTGERADAEHSHWSSTRYYDNDDEITIEPNATHAITKYGMEYSILVDVVDESLFQIRVDLSNDVRPLYDGISVRDTLPANSYKYYSFFGYGYSSEVRFEVTPVGTGRAPQIFVSCNLVLSNSTVVVPSRNNYTWSSDVTLGGHHEYPVVEIEQDARTVNTDDPLACSVGTFAGGDYFIAVMSSDPVTFSILGSSLGSSSVATIHEGESLSGVLAQGQYRFYTYLVDTPMQDAGNSRMVKFQATELSGKVAMYISRTYTRARSPKPCPSDDPDNCSSPCKCSLLPTRVCIPRGPKQENLCVVADPTKCDASVFVADESVTSGDIKLMACDPSEFLPHQLPVGGIPDSFQWDSVTTHSGEVFIDVSKLAQGNDQVDAPFIQLTVGVTGLDTDSGTVYFLTASEFVNGTTPTDGGDDDGGGGARAKVPIELRAGTPSPRISLKEDEVATFLFRINSKPSGDLNFDLTTMSGDVDIGISRTHMPVWESSFGCDKCTWAAQGFGNETVKISESFPCSTKSYYEPCDRAVVFNANRFDGTFKISVKAMQDSVFSLMVRESGDHMLLQTGKVQQTSTQSYETCANSKRNLENFACEAGSEETINGALFSALVSASDVLRNPGKDVVVTVEYADARDSFSWSEECRGEGLAVVVASCRFDVCTLDDVFPEESSASATPETILRLHDQEDADRKSSLSIQLPLKDNCVPTESNSCLYYVAVRNSGTAPCVTRSVPFAITYAFEDSPVDIQDGCFLEGDGVCLVTGDHPTQLQESSSPEHVYRAFLSKPTTVELEVCSGAVAMTLCTTANRMTGECMHGNTATSPQVRGGYASSTLQVTGSNSFYQMGVRTNVAESTFRLRMMPFSKVGATSLRDLQVDATAKELRWEEVQNVETTATKLACENIAYFVYAWVDNQPKTAIQTTPCGLDAIVQSSNAAIIYAAGERTEVSVLDIGLQVEKRYRVSVLAKCSRCTFARGVDAGDFKVVSTNTVVVNGRMITGDGTDNGDGGGNGQGGGGDGNVVPNTGRSPMMTLLIVVLAVVLVSTLGVVYRLRASKQHLHQRLQYELHDMRSLVGPDDHMVNGASGLTFDDDDGLYRSSDNGGTGLLGDGYQPVHI